MRLEVFVFAVLRLGVRFPPLVRAAVASAMVCAPIVGNVAIVFPCLQLMSMLLAYLVKQIPSVFHGRGPLLFYQFLLKFLGNVLLWLQRDAVREHERE